MNVEEIMDEIRSLPMSDTEQIFDKLKTEIDEKRKFEVRSIIESHKPYVGKCYKKRVKPYSSMFPEMWRYIKVISERGSNEYRMSALVFDEHPTYWFAYKHMRNVGHYYVGEFEFDGICVENYPFFCVDYWDHGADKNVIDYLTEISLEEYNAAMDNYIKELQELPWYADHYRIGGKLPTDEGWSAEK